MSWVQREIERYENAERSAMSLIPIPSELQVGKILRHFAGNTVSSRKYILKQINEDGTLVWSYGPQDPDFGPSYWQEVLRRFDSLLERDLNKIITEP